MVAISFLISCEVGPNVLKNAHRMESPIIRANSRVGKYICIGFCRISTS